MATVPEIRFALRRKFPSFPRCFDTHHKESFSQSSVLIHFSPQAVENTVENTGNGNHKCGLDLNNIIDNGCRTFHHTHGAAKTNKREQFRRSDRKNEPKAKWPGL